LDTSKIKNQLHNKIYKPNVFISINFCSGENTSRKETEIKTFIFFIFFLFANTLYSQWIDDDFETGSYFCIFFTDKNVGWISGGDNYKGYIFKTNDGGINWIKTDFPDTHELTSIHFINESKGWAVGDSGIVITTSDGGDSWTFQNSGTKSYLSSVFFSDENNGWICYGYMVGFPSSKAYGVILHTDDGGENWDIQKEVENYRFTDIYFHDDKTGWAVGSNHQNKTEIYLTSDGGNDWNPVSINTIWKSFYSIRFIDDLTGWLVGESGIILKTTDGGNTWTPQTDGYKGYNLNSCFIVDQNTVYTAGRYGYILYTADGGETWIEQERVTSQTLNSVYFTDKMRGWAVGYGVVLSTSNGGVTFAEAVSAEIPAKYMLSHNYPNPFNPSTSICYAIPERNHVVLTVYNTFGQQVIRLVEQEIEAGTHEVIFDASHLPSGVYMYRLQAGKYVESRKMLYLR